MSARRLLLFWRSRGQLHIVTRLSKVIPMFNIRYLPGCKPGRKMSAQAATAKSGSSQSPSVSVNKRPRSFCDSWRVGRPWLAYDPMKHVMTCELCVRHQDYIEDLKVKSVNKDSNFVTGSNNFRKTAVTDHEFSKAHIKAVALDQAKQQKENNTEKTSTAGMALLSLKEKDREKMRLMFRNAHAVAKHNRPIADFVWLNDLDQAKGYTVSDTYRNEKAGGVFIDNIADIERSQMYKDIAKASFFSLTMDGTTDISAVEQETLFIRMANNGKIISKFLEICEPESTSADDIYATITACLDGMKECDVNVSNQLVGFTCDGASNMLGKHRGAATQLRADYPDIVITHCICHRLELAQKDAIKREAPKLYDRVVTLLVGLYYFYHKSSKQRKGLRKTCLMLDMATRVPPRVGGTRWMAHMKRALEYVLEAFPALVTHLCNESHNNAKAEGLVKLLLRYDIFAFALFLRVCSWTY